MLTRFVRVQLAIFAVLSVASLIFFGIRYLNVGGLLGTGEYDIAARFDDAQGLYVNSKVTYRGVPVGVVEDLRLVEQGMAADLSINANVRIPADVTAEVHSRSAAGEQFILLEPHRSGGPYLQDGDVISNERTSVPVGIGTVLKNINQLVASLPQDELTTVIHELYMAFNGTDGDLQRLLDSSNALLDSARANLRSTRQLINAGEIVLNTQQEVSRDIRSYSTDLVAFTATLVNRDRELRSLLESGQPFAERVRRLLEELHPETRRLLTGIETIGEVVTPRRAALEQMLVIYPAITAALQGAIVAAPGNKVPLDLLFQVNNPPLCDSGYEQTQRRPPSELSLTPSPTGLHCDISPDAASSVRGARNAPCLVGHVGKRTAFAKNCSGTELGRNNGARPGATSPFAEGPPFVTGEVDKGLRKLFLGSEWG